MICAHECASLQLVCLQKPKFYTATNAADTLHDNLHAARILREQELRTSISSVEICTIWNSPKTKTVPHGILSLNNLTGNFPV